MAQHNILGQKGEILAKEYLVKEGYNILELNWRYKKSEVDVICIKEGTLIFCEVKTRATSVHGYPEEAVHFKKQKKLVEAAEQYVEQTNFESEIRFDIISIIISGKRHQIHHIKDAFFPYQE